MAVSRSLTRLGQRYVRFAKIEDAEQTQLYIKSIRDGSLIVDLSPLAVLAGAVMSSPEAFNTSVEFIRNLKGVIDYFAVKGPRPSDLKARDCDDVKEIVQPVAVQRDALFSIQASQGSTVAVTINLNQTEANAIQNRATRERAIMQEPKNVEFKNELFYWQTADRHKASEAGQTPDRGVIESIDERPRRVFVPDPIVKAKLVAGAVFETLHVVDGETIVAKDRVQAYRITAVHESFLEEEG
jgi:hypothetical protein